MTHSALLEYFVEPEPADASLYTWFKTYAKDNYLLVVITLNSNNMIAKAIPFQNSLWLSLANENTISLIKLIQNVTYTLYM